LEGEKNNDPSGGSKLVEQKITIIRYLEILVLKEIICMTLFEGVVIGWNFLIT